MKRSNKETKGKRAIIISIVAVVLIGICLVYHFFFGDEMIPSKAVDQKTIKITYTRNCNFAYHMMSVAKCGYDNAYGAKYRELHSKEDLAKLKENEDYITASGGVHEGSLYSVLVCTPASMPDDINLGEYYEKLAKEASTSDLKNHEIVEQLAMIMANNYDIYCEKVWPETQEVLKEQTETMQKFFDRKDYMKLWEKETGCTYKYPFEVLLCNSISNGAEAILITEDKDVFQIIEDNEDGQYDLMCHEAGMSLLRSNGIFDHESQEEGFQCYDGEEGLTEYYNEKVMGYRTQGMWDEDITDWFKEQEKDGKKTPKELIEMWKEENVNS